MLYFVTMHWISTGNLTKKKKKQKHGINRRQVCFVQVRVLPGGRGATPPGRRLWNQGSDSVDCPVPPCPSSPGRPSGLPTDGELSSCPWKEKWATGSQTRHWNSPEPWSLRSITGGLDNALYCTPDYQETPDLVISEVRVFLQDSNLKPLRSPTDHKETHTI